MESSLSLCYDTHLNDVLGSLADKIWDGPEGGQDSLYSLGVAAHVVFQAWMGGLGVESTSLSSSASSILKLPHSNKNV